MVNADVPGQSLDESAILKAPTQPGNGVCVLCREEALVYVENFFRGDRTPSDLAALAGYLGLLPKGDEATFPFDRTLVLQQVTAALAILQHEQV